jgi:hypothetical protein
MGEVKMEARIKTDQEKCEPGRNESWSIKNYGHSVG